MNKVEPVLECTIKLLELLENGAETDRDEKIKQIHDSLKKRGHMMTKLVPPYTEQERALGVRLVELNKKLAVLLEREKTAIAQDIQTLHVKKKSNKKYTNPYESLGKGAVFYDKRQ